MLVVLIFPFIFILNLTVSVYVFLKMTLEHTRVDALKG